jgi:Arc/MetJ family transcription regulator
MAHTLASASTFSSASPQSNYSCDVFINHRGIDVKKTLASHLYRRLLSHRLQVFLDQPELKRGEKIDSQIERAIETASVQVAIFSPRYADSSWCLDELVLMLKSDATIVPVFYNVKPSDLRWTDKGINNDRVAEALRILRQTGRYRVFVHALRILRWTGKYTLYVQALRNLRWTGSDRVYAEALLNHAKKGRYDQERLAAWRKALSDVSHISGFELEACNGLVLYLSFSVLA